MSKIDLLKDLVVYDKENKVYLTPKIITVVMDKEEMTVLTLELPHDDDKVDVLVDITAPSLEFTIKS